MLLNTEGGLSTETDTRKEEEVLLFQLMQSALYHLADTRRQKCIMETRFSLS